MRAIGFNRIIVSWRRALYFINHCCFFLPLLQPYYFLRHPESSPLRGPVIRSSTAEDLAKLDAESPLGQALSIGVEEGQLFSQAAQRRWPPSVVEEDQSQSSDSLGEQEKTTGDQETTVSCRKNQF